MRQRHDFSVTAYVVMPEHIHQLVSEPRARLLARRFRRLSLNQSSTYTYDEFNRLSGTFVGNNQTYSFGYDRWGNRLTQTALQGGTTSVLNINTANNQVTGTGSAPNSFTYDAAGNLTSDGAYTYTYDPDGNVLTAGTSSGTVTTTYTYDALNRRVRIQAARGAFEFAFDANGRRVSTWNAPGGSLSEALAYWGAQPVAFHTPGNGGYTHFQYQDWLGTERLRTSGATAAVEGTYKSLPYGDGYTSSGNDYDWYHFAGQDFDPESNTQHAQFRQYASVQGRWMSPDPYDGSYDFTNPQSFNLYSYVLNSPLSFIDPSGLTTTCTGATINGVYYPGTCTYYPDGGAASPEPGSTVPWWIAEYGGTVCGSANGSAWPCTKATNTTASSSSVAPKNDPPKSPKRQACEANEVAYANRTRSDFLAGAGGRVLSDVKNGALGGGFSVGAGGLVAGPPGGAVGVFVGVVVGAAGAAIVGGFSEIGNQFLYDNSLLGFGGTYQKQLTANIQKNCAGM